jgi:hypothetical protein
MDKTPRIMILIFFSGILNILLGILHQFVLYFDYQKYVCFRTAETAQCLADFLIFSMAVGIVLIFMGLLTCYCYSGIKKNEKWAWVISSGISLLLFIFMVAGLIILGVKTPIAYVHLLNSLLISIPLLLNLKLYTNSTLVDYSTLSLPNAFIGSLFS